MTAEPSGSIRFDRMTIGGWEMFQFKPIASARTDLANMLKSIEAKGRLDEVSAISLLTPCIEVGDIAGAVIRLHAPSDLLQLVPRLRDQKTYPFLFAHLRNQIARGSFGNVSPFKPQIMWGFSSDSVAAGRYTYGYPRILPYHGARAVLGRFCSIADNVTIILGNHLTSIPTYQFFSNKSAWPSLLAGKHMDDFVPGDVVVGNDVWIGYGATLLAGSNVGDGTIVGAGAIVRGRIPPYSLYAGNPGRVIKSRFDTRTVHRLLALRWWDWPEWKIDRHSIPLMSGDMEAFLTLAESDLD